MNVEIYLSVLSLVIASIAVYISCRHHKTDEDKLRLDLYEKRFKVYQSILDLLDIVSNKADLNREKILNFH